MLSFRLGSEEYAVLVEDVKEVLKNRELTHVPNAPDHILGRHLAAGTDPARCRSFANAWACPRREG